MRQRVAAAVMLIVLLAACAGSIDEGPTPLPPPPLDAPAAAPTPPATSPAVAPNVAAPPATPEPNSGDGSIVVPGTRERQIAPPSGDPRSVAERIEDVRAWDQCVSRTQAAFETDPTRPQLETPEDVCSRALGMADRLAVPESRRR